MKPSRIITYGMAVIAFALSILAYINYIYMLGFPDGFISELAVAQRRLVYIFILASSVFAVIFIYQGVAKKPSKALGISSTLYILMIVVLLLINAYYGVNLTGSIGG
jgi:hypothetical protein